MGNIWRFPIMVQQYGGMTFLLPYFLFVILIGASGVIEEFALGRRAKAGPVGAFGMCTKERTGSDKAGKAFGAIPIIGADARDRLHGRSRWIFKYAFCRSAACTARHRHGRDRRYVWRDRTGG